MATTFTFRTTLDEYDWPLEYEIFKDGKKVFEATYGMYSPEDNNLRRNFKDVLRLPEIFKLIVEAGPDVNFVEETVLKEEEVW